MSFAGGRALETSIEGKKAITQLQEREYKIKFDLQKLDVCAKTESTAPDDTKP